MRTRKALTLLGLVAVVAAALTATTAVLPVAAQDGVAKRAAKDEIKAAHIQTSAGTRTLPTLSGAFVSTAKAALSPDAADTAGDTGAALNGNGNLGLTPGTLGCRQRDGKAEKGNVRVNQDCTFRRQAEEDITFNPADPGNLVGGQNDSRVGFNQCGFDYSTDNGSHWGDGLPPFRQHFNSPEFDGPNTVAGGQGTDHTYDFASDPALAVDSQGRAYYSCVMIDVLTPASGLFVTQSPLGADGSFYDNIPNIGRRFIVAEDISPTIAHDKNMISADRYATLPNGQANPNRDNVYVTWTVFKFQPTCVTPDNPSGYCESPIFGSMSTDHALHWSQPREISGTAPGTCFVSNLFINGTFTGSDCNFDQGSYSVVNPDGSLEVIFNNGNTALGNPNSQQLGVHCMPTGDSATGTANLNCGTPVKVGNDMSFGEPTCNFGRGPEECIPGAFIRTNDFPRITKDNTQDGHLYAVWQDYRNGEFDVQLSQSLDGGLTWQEAGTVNPDRGLDHYFPATDQTPGGNDRNGVSYFRTERVPNENAGASGGFKSCNPAQGGNPSACNAGTGLGNSDYVLAGGRGDDTPYVFRVVSPVFAPPDGGQSGFNGDYSGLTINRGEEAHPIWSDTRNIVPAAINAQPPGQGVVHDEDIFTDTVGLPNGRGSDNQPGRIGED